MSMMHVMDGTGDTKIEWDPDSEAEVAAARATFNTLRSEKRYVGYRVEAGGTKGEVIREFDPDAEKIILAPPLAGG